MANKRIREAAISCSSSSISRGNLDVFLSTFSQDPSNKIIIDGIYNALVQRGIHTLRSDDDEHKQLRGGEKSLIEESKIAIVLFSRKYVSSIWCLDELVKIIECRSNGTGLTVFPVFCDVDPSDVRKQTGCLEEAFARHGRKGFEEKVESWRPALTTAANLSGWDLHNISNGHEEKFIQRIVDGVVLIKRSRTPLNIASYLVGIDSHIATFLSTDCSILSPHEVHIVGIWGISGLGKTTIAKAIYNEICHRYEGYSFLENVREVSQQHNGLINLQEQLLSDVLVKKNLKISNVARGINVIKHRLHCKKVLIVIDDVDHSEQLNALVVKHDSFGVGSLIIVISRDKHLLNEVEACHIYHPEELDSHESLQLFSWHAFKSDCPPDDYKEFSKEIVSHVKGLPLALEVMGSTMFGKRSLSEWENVLAKLKSTPDYQIQKKLRLSFNDLDDMEKDIFLDIACFFIGVDESYASKILDGCNLFPVIGISVLIQRSLIAIDEKKKLRMHDLLREMAKEIVREESPEQPGRRTRLWSKEDVCDALAKHKGTKSVEGIILNISQFEDVCFNTEAFVDMRNLRLLQLNYVHLRGGYEHLSKKLKWLCWHGFPLNSIPTNFDMENLIVLHMENSSVKEVWKEIKLLKRLKILNLSHSSYLRKTPNFLGVPSLEELVLEDCKSLVEVHQSIGYLDKLIVLNLKNCNNLMKLPDSIGMLTSLEELNLHGCSKLVERSTYWFSSFPQYLGSLKRHCTSTNLLPSSFSRLCFLKSVNLNHCNLSEDMIPNDFWSLPLLRVLRMENNRFCTLPANIRHLSHLSRLSLIDCRDLKLMTELPPMLERLYVSGCSMEILPSTISNLSGLDLLYANRCKRLQSFPELPPSLAFLEAEGCTSLQGVDVEGLEYLRKLRIDYDHFCSKSYEISCLKLQSLTLEGCVNCREIQSMETCHQSVQRIHIEERYCHDLGNSLRKNSFYHFQDHFEIWGSGSEIPEWISHQNMGSSVSFEVSHDCSRCLIRGLDVSAVFLVERFILNLRALTVICNKTKGIQWRAYVIDWQNTGPLPPGQELLWVRHITIPELWDFSGHEVVFGDHFEVGDEVEVSVEIQAWSPSVSLQVKKCGVLLVHRLDVENKLSDDGITEEYKSASDDDDDDVVIVDGDKESVLVHIEDDQNKISGHNIEDIPGFSIDAKRLRIDL
ncbi:disease resistance protein RUN1-like isoform X2 [Macadamia integrifolia]|uniref:disease resistance protein RUN1-like isoform X2 n=1 Tax=Macadamia integrifolia TaxID=60698 RepID=UPI001C4E7FA5|nr:disease resistance protein RUN1-like isoform X2 [Macadamia integrifolia]